MIDLIFLVLYPVEMSQRSSKITCVGGTSWLRITGQSPYLLAVLIWGGTPSTPPLNFWRVNHGNAAPGFWEQAVTWNSARSDFLPVVFPPIPQACSWPFKRRGSFKLKADWFAKEVALEEDAMNYIDGCWTSVVSVRFLNIVECCSYSWHSVLRNKHCRVTRAQSDEELCLHSLQCGLNVLFHSEQGLQLLILRVYWNLLYALAFAYEYQ